MRLSFRLFLFFLSSALTLSARFLALAVPHFGVRRLVCRTIAFKQQQEKRKERKPRNAAGSRRKAVRLPGHDRCENLPKQENTALRPSSPEKNPGATGSIPDK